MSGNVPSNKHDAHVASRVAFCALVVALLVLFSAPVRAQETTNAKTNQQVQETTVSDVGQTDQTVSQAGSGENETTTQTRAQTANRRLVFAPGTEVPAISRARQPVGGPLVGTRVETRSRDNDNFVEVIFIPAPTCKAEQGASFDLRDEDGTQATFTENDGENDLEEDENVRIQKVLGRGFKATRSGKAGNNIEPVNERGSDGVLDTGGLKVVSSTDITCKDATSGQPTDGGSNTQNGAPVTQNRCGPVVDLETDQPIGTLRGTDDLSFRYTDRGENSSLRIAYATSSEDGTLNIRVTPRSGGNAIIDRTITGAETGVLERGTQEKASYEIQLLPTDQGYAIFLQIGEGNEECVKPASLNPVEIAAEGENDATPDEDDDVLTGTVPNHDLPDTGGLPLTGLIVLVLASVVASASVIRGVGRRE